MGSRPPLRRTPSRSPPPSSSTSTPPTTSNPNPGKIIRLNQRPADPSISRADVNPSRNLVPRKRPALTPSPSSAASPSPAPSSSLLRRPNAWNRRPNPHAKHPPPPAPSDPRPEPITPTKNPAIVRRQEASPEPKPSNVKKKPQMDPIDERPAGTEVETASPEGSNKPGPDLTEDDSSADADAAAAAAAAAAAEEEVDAAFDVVMEEGSKVMKASSDWVGEASRGIVEDIAKLAKRGPSRALVKLLTMMMTDVMEPMEEHVRVLGETGSEIGTMLDQIRRERGREADEEEMVEGEEKTSATR